MEHQIIYQFCYHNYNNEFEMLSRIKNTLKDYKKEMMDIEKYSYNLELFSKEKRIILVDIVPNFLKPSIFEFDFESYLTEENIMHQITQITLDFIANNEEYDDTLVFQIIHNISQENGDI